MTTLMINSAKVDNALRQIAGVRTISERVDILKTLDDPWLRKTVIYAHDPYKRFGVKVTKSEQYTLIAEAQQTGGLDIDDADIWTLLDHFLTSTESPSTKKNALHRLIQRCNIQTTHIVLGILDKALAKNVSESTINKAWPGAIPVFSVQLAQKYSDKKVKSFPHYVEIKYDGMRATGLIYPNNDVELKTRTGRDIPAAAYFHDELIRFGKAYRAVAKHGATGYEGCVVDGELIGATFNEAVSTFRSSAVAKDGQYAIFDVLPMAAITSSTFVSKTLTERRQLLWEIFKYMQDNPSAGSTPVMKIIRSESYIANSKEEIWAMYYGARAKGNEGVIVKDPNGLWERKRSNAWLKIKAEETADLRIIGAFEGTGEKEGTLGGLIVKGTIGAKTIEARVGSGYTDAESNVIWNMFLRDLELYEQGERDDEAFELIGCIVEVQYQEITADNSLRHPVFVKLRKDKNEVSF